LPRGPPERAGPEARGNQIYNKKLDERNKRKRFTIDRGLVDFKKQQQQERKRTKEERDLVARLRIFARFQTAEEHEALVDGLIKARKLRSQIALYQHYRRMGVRTLEQGRAYEVERKLKAQKQRQQTPYLFQPPAGAAAGSTAAAAAASSQASTSDAAFSSRSAVSV
jgi:transcriptional adapter 2-alpha